MRRNSSTIVLSFRPWLVSLPVGLSACAGGTLVERAYDGHVVEGRAIEPQAYAAFLDGAIAEASFDLRGALAFYERAARIDPAGPETWTRIGAVRCAADPRDGRADRAFARALAIDARHAATWDAKARCASARGDAQAMADAARTAASLDPAADGANAMLARTPRAAADPGTRAALVALTATAREPAAAWEALASWAESRGDVALWSLALQRVARFDSTRRGAVARSAEDLAGVGELGAARAVAAAAIDAGDPSEGTFASDSHPLAARLAVDEALGRRDEGAARLRSTRARVGLDEAGARAWLAGRPELGRALASSLVRADPLDAGARLVLALCEGRDLVGAAAEVRRAGGVASIAAIVAFGVAAERTLSPEDTRATLAAIAASTANGAGAPRIHGGDDLVVRPAVELVARGLLDASSLPPDGLVELSAWGGAPSGEVAAKPDGRAIDARHEYLSLALAEPAGARTREVGSRLRAVAATDPIVVAADALVRIGMGAPLQRSEARDLLARAPGDPLVAATALRLANRIGDAQAAATARTALTAFGAREVRDAPSSGPKSGPTL